VGGLFNQKRLHSAIGFIPPAEAEANDYNQRASAEKLKNGLFYCKQIAAAISDALHFLLPPPMPCRHLP